MKNLTLVRELLKVISVLSVFHCANWSFAAEESQFAVGEDNTLEPQCVFSSIKNSNSLENVEKCLSLKENEYTESQRLFLALTVKKLKEEGLKAESGTK